MKKQIWDIYASGKTLTPRYDLNSQKTDPSKMIVSEPVRVRQGNVIKTQPIELKEEYSNTNLFIFIFILVAILFFLTFKISI